MSEVIKKSHYIYPVDYVLLLVNQFHVLTDRVNWENSKLCALLLVEELQKESTMVRVSPTPRFDYFEDVKTRIKLL